MPTKKPEDNRSLSIYLRDIGGIPMLSRSKELEIARRAREGNLEAREQLAAANLRFVVRVATKFRKKYGHLNLSLEDYISFGNEGVMEAAKNYDERMNVKFISYAVYWINQKIWVGIAEHSRTVRLPLNRVDFLAKVTKETKLLAQTLGREPTIEEVIDILPDEEPAFIREVAGLSKATLSLDEPHGESGDETFLAAVEGTSDEAVDAELRRRNEELREFISDLIKGLKSRETEILRHYFGLDGYEAKTLEEIGGVFDLTRERVRQIKEKAIHRLKLRGGERLKQYYQEL